MATVSSTLKMFDAMSNPLRKITNSMNIVISTMQQLNSTTERNEQISRSLSSAQEMLAEAGLDLRRAAMNAETEQRRLNDQMRRGQSESAGLLRNIKRLAGAYIGFSAGKNFIGSSITAANQQFTAETRLQLIMSNIPDMPQESIDMLKSYAAELQGVTNIGDEVGIFGMSQLAEYVYDPQNIKELTESMYNLATETYGVNVAQEQIMQTANLMGKVMMGDINALARNGFKIDAIFTEAEQQLLRTGTEAERTAMVVQMIEENLSGLSRAMANTPEGQIVQLNNAWGDVKETVGFGVLPQILRLMETFRNNLPTIQNLLYGLVGVVVIITTALTSAIDIAVWGFKFLFEAIQSVGTILLGLSPIILGIAGAWGAYNAVMLLSTLYTKGAAMASTIYMLATNGIARALSIAALQQKFMNLVMSLNPIGIVIGLIVGLISALLAFSFVTNGVRETFSNAFGFIVDAAQAAVNAIIGILNTGIKAINKISGFFSNLLGVDEKKIQEIEFRADFESFKQAGQDLIENATLDDIKAKFGLDKLGDSSMLAKQNALLEKWNAQQDDNFGITNENLGKVADNISISNEDLKLMRELAEMRNVQNFVTLTPTVNVETGDITEGGFDLNTMIARITDVLEREIASSAEGVFS